MYPTVDVQTTLTYARLHQEEVRASYPHRRRDRTSLLRRAWQPVRAAARLLTPPAHRTAAA